ncbi:MAG: hypothetical protein IKA71_02035 [Lentisphaeria bacterium]|nr:hypothetical protein [Lentisphaeria bacterium]
MNKRQIIGIFLIFLHAMIFIPALRADIPVASRVQLRREISGRDARFIRNIVRQLDRLRRTAGMDLPETTLRIIPGAGRLHCAGTELFIPGDANLWETDTLLRHRIYTALAAHRFSIDCPGEPPPAAAWAAYGLDDACRAAVSMGKYVSGNITFPQLASIHAVSGKLPDFIALCRQDLFSTAATASPAGEQARLLLHIMAENRRIRDLFQGLITGEKPDFWLQWYLSAGNARNILDVQARKILWNRFSPLPPQRVLERMKTMLVFQIPELTETGEFSGNMLSVDFTTFAGLLKSDRPDAAQIRDANIKTWRQLSSVLTSAERKQCLFIISEIRNAGVEDDAPEKFNKAVNTLTALVNDRIKTEKFLKDSLDRYSAPAVRLALPLDAAEYSAPAASAAEKEFFFRTFDSYVR